MDVPKPENEAGRLAALESYGIMASTPQGPLHPGLGVF